MIFLSLYVGIPINGIWSSLYNFEFPSVLGMIKAGTFTKFQEILWLLLLTTHVAIFCLPFITNKKYFRDCLIIAPALFMLFYFFLGGLTAIFLIPFSITWIIAVFKQGRVTKGVF